MIRRKVFERTDDGMYDRNSVREREHHGRNNRRGKKKTESGEKFLKGHPGFGLSLRPPQPSLFLSGMTLSSVRPFTGGKRINAPNNYTDIPGKPVLFAKAVLQMRIPQCNRPGNVPHKC